VRFQSGPNRCGAAAIVNALRALGSRISERRGRVAACTDDNEGTSEDGIISGSRLLGFSAVPFSSDDLSVAWALLMESLRSGKPVIICVDEWGHWVTCVGCLGDQALIIDPSNTRANKTENGVSVLKKRDLERRWKKTKKEDDVGGAFYGIAIGKK
jgi:ABC-type bacteriocin/lantibiotic exporter with double-glycine peptidase domain